MGEEPEDVQPVVYCDRNHPLAGHVFAIVPRLGSISVLKAATENVYQNRQSLSIRLGGRPYVQEEAVFAHPLAAEPVVGIRRRALHTACSESIGIADSGPVL